ncbi:hypothetical protein [Priestia aryabhattai]
MDVQTIANLFLTLVITAAVVSLLIGVFVTFKKGSYKKGFISTLISSIVCLIIIVSWYEKASSEVFMGTIPWILNILAVIIILPIYLLVIYFVFKKLIKSKKNENEKTSG